SAPAGAGERCRLFVYRVRRLSQQHGADKAGGIPVPDWGRSAPGSSRFARASSVKGEASRVPDARLVYLDCLPDAKGVNSRAHPAGKSAGHGGLLYVTPRRVTPFV